MTSDNILLSPTSCAEYSYSNEMVPTGLDKSLIYDEEDETMNEDSKYDDDIIVPEPLSIPEKIAKFQELWESGLSGHSFTAVSGIDDIPKFHEEDFSVTKLLGRGAFADVHEAYIKENADEMYALKRLRPSVLEDKESFEISTSDLAFETSILSNLRHENIIYLHGMKEGNTMDLLRDGNFFLTLELLDETLHSRHKKWAKQWKRQKMLRSSLSPNIVITRLEKVAMGVVSAMEFLHVNNIIYRDIKPLNIGFDKRNRVKLFDFGFARLCNSKDGDRLMTGGIGTPRYMAPEVANYDENYSFPVDVYSFSIMLWQIVTSQTPFKDVKSAEELAHQITIENKRPSLAPVQMEPLKELIEAGWSSKPEDRPTFKDIKRKINRIVVNYHLQQSSSISSFFAPGKKKKSRSSTVSSHSSTDW